MHQGRVLARYCGRSGQGGLAPGVMAPTWRANRIYMEDFVCSKNYIKNHMLPMYFFFNFKGRCLLGTFVLHCQYLQMVLAPDP